MKKILSAQWLFSVLAMSLFTISPATTMANSPEREFYEIRIYQFTNAGQEQIIDLYLKDALIPALHRAGIKKVGAFKPIGNDTASIRKAYILIPYHSLIELDAIDGKLEKDKTYLDAGSDYINAAHNNPPYTRFAKIILKAFTGSPVMSTPDLSGSRKERVYELRSYEGGTEKLYKTKLKMFNTGDEIGLFKKLGFNAVFYGEVLAGTAMPNLMYMTTFKNQQSRDEHWKSFVDSPEWNKLKADKQYDNTVSHTDITFLYPTEYSDL